MLSKGPVVIYMDGDGISASNSDFKHHSSEIIDAKMTCSIINNAVVALGINKDEKGEFLISRNLVTSWGENGNFRIMITSKDHTCFMQDYALLPEVIQTLNPVPPPPVKPGCLKLECKLQGTQTEICSNTALIKSSIAGFDLRKFSEVKVFLRGKILKEVIKHLILLIPAWPTMDWKI